MNRLIRETVQTLDMSATGTTYTTEIMVESVNAYSYFISTPTSGATGTIALQARNGASGPWATVYFTALASNTTVNSISIPSTGTDAIALNLKAWQRTRLAYTRTGGSGTLTAYIFGQTL